MTKNEELTKTRSTLKEDYEKLEKAYRKKEQIFKACCKKSSEIRIILDDSVASREKIKTHLSTITKTFDKKKDKVDEDRKDIEQKTRERDLLNKDVATAEEKEREQLGGI